MSRDGVRARATMDPMTARLDRENPDIVSWVTCATAQNGRLRLDASAFFPGGEGQVADTGRVRWSGGEVAVTSVVEEGSDIVIELDADVPDGVHVLECAVDVQWRRQHWKSDTD